jgi:hypothetical protein
MDDNPQANQPIPSANPTELLSAQAQSLSELVKIQNIQKEQIEELQRQNERMIGLLSTANQGDSSQTMTRVKIEDVNMPFGALIGFLVKVSLASIPAVLILTVIYFLIIFVLSMLGLAVGGIF